VSLFGRCVCCGRLTLARALWPARVHWVYVWCCDACVVRIGPVERGKLDARAWEIERSSRLG
jgi:hypothetical protein